MTYPRERAIAILTWAVLALVAACGPSTRQTALRATLVTLDGAGAVFVAWDREHQLRLVKDAATPEAARNLIASYRVSREPVLATFEIAYRALAHAAVLDDDATLSAALATVLDLKAAIEHLGATWPKDHP